MLLEAGSWKRKGEMELGSFCGTVTERSGETEEALRIDICLKLSQLMDPALNLTSGKGL